MVALALLIAMPIAASPPGIAPAFESFGFVAANDTSYIAKEIALPAAQASVDRIGTESAVNVESAVFKPYYLYAVMATLAGLMCFSAFNLLSNPKKREYLSRLADRMIHYARDQPAIG